MSPGTSEDFPWLCVPVVKGTTMADYETDGLGGEIC